MDYQDIQRKILLIVFAVVFSVFVSDISGQTIQQNQAKTCNVNNLGGNNGIGDASDSAYDGKIEYKPKVYPVGIKPLLITSKPMAKYTDEAKRNCIQGTIELRITFFASGRLGNIKVLKGLSYGLSNQAIEAAKLVKFQPEIRKNKAITITKTLQYTFTIY